MPRDSVSGVWFETVGEGRPLLVCLAMMASQRELFGEGGAALREAYLAQLTDRYRVCLIDYPSIGRSDDIPPEQLTAERVNRDLLAVADAAGFDRFAYFGYSWGGAVGLQLAAHSDRVAALAIGGWAPLGAPLAPMLAAARGRIGNPPASAMVVLRSVDQYRQWPTYYDSIAGLDEAATLAAIDCPGLVFFGSDGDLDEDGHAVPIASAIRASRPALASKGWRVTEVPGEGHGVIGRADLVGPVLRDFLDEVWT